MKCYIGLGSNLSKPIAQLQCALNTIEHDDDLQLVHCSSFYQSRALVLPDTVEQNDYINAVACIETALSAEALLIKLHGIEALQGRERKEKWAARTLDLDILLYGNECIESATLSIPHRQLQYRNFVIHPLFEVAGAIELPVLGSLAVLAENTDWDGLLKLTALS
jgi:2-amino-4-hydroxy-6-hydroxymethyldihydropteridine diphosphokinase